MRHLISIILLLISFESFAKQQNIVAIVNDVPITKYDFDLRKKMIIAVNKIDNSSPMINRQLDEGTLNILVEEELLNQYAAKMGKKIPEEEIDHVISSIEERSNMSKGYLLKQMKSLGVSTKSFRQQIKNELIKHKIIDMLSGSVSVTPSEIDMAVSSSGHHDFDIVAWKFSSFDLNENSLKKMQKLSKKISSCDKELAEKSYSDFANSKKLEQNLNNLSDKTKSVIFDTKENSSSQIYQEDGKFKFIFLCNKTSLVSKKDVNNIRNFLFNNKRFKKADKFFKDLRAKSYIEILY